MIEYRGQCPKHSLLESWANSLIVNPDTKRTGTAAPTLHSLRRDSPLCLLFLAALFHLRSFLPPLSFFPPFLLSSFLLRQHSPLIPILILRLLPNSLFLYSHGRCITRVAALLKMHTHTHTPFEFGKFQTLTLTLAIVC